MKRFSYLPSLVLAALLSAAALTPGHAAVRAPDASLLAADETYLHFASADCSALGQAEAARAGGQLLRAVAVQRGNQTVCVITLAVPSQDGKPPRRVERQIPIG
jgi:hypothetical protein